MKRKVKQVTRLASQLTDPQPEFVSLVGHGANQTPFRTVKAAHIIAAIHEQEDETMTKAKEKKAAAADVSAEADIQRATFDTAQFDSADKVSQFLEAKGYTNFTVTEAKGGGFEVIAKAEGDFEGELKALKVAKGVTFYVGKLAEGAAPLEVTEKAAETKAAAAEAAPARLFKAMDMDSGEIVKKYCDYYCGPTYTPPQGMTLAQVLTEQYENGCFPAYWNLAEAFQTALFNLVKAGETAKIKTLTAEFGDMITAILAALSAAGVDVTAKAAFLKEKDTAMTKETKAAEKPAGAAATETAAKADETKTETKTEGGEAAPAAEGAAPAAEKKQDPAPAEKQAGAGNEIAAAVAEAMKAVVAPLADTLKTLGETVKGMSDGLEAAKEAATKANARVDELASSRTSRKSADDNGITPGSREAAASEDQHTKTQKADDEFARRQRKNALGISA